MLSPNFILPYSNIARFLSALFCVQFLLLTDCLSWYHLWRNFGLGRVRSTPGHLSLFACRELNFALSHYFCYWLIQLLALVLLYKPWDGTVLWLCVSVRHCDTFRRQSAGKQWVPSSPWLPFQSLQRTSSPSVHSQSHISPQYRTLAWCQTLAWHTPWLADVYASSDLVYAVLLEPLAGLPLGITVASQVCSRNKQYFQFEIKINQVVLINFHI